jgi:photosystem II stability/assembly factor-like uncharacterized protein
MKRAVILIALALTVSISTLGQWDIQDSHSATNFRGIHAVDDTIAWASGTEGTVLRTLDGGAHWQKCTTPPGAEKLDFRGIWAWDANSASVMSAGPGDLSRLYRTTDGCAHWIEERKNSEKEGFWDAIAFHDKAGVLIGDPINGHFYTEIITRDRGWHVDDASCAALPGEAAFAASNSSVVMFDSGKYLIGTGGKSGPRVLLSPLLAYNDSSKGCLGVSVPLASGNESSGIFSLAFRDLEHGVAVGGDYKKPEESTGTVAFTSDGGRHWTAATKPPHGYRSTVAWNSDAKVWIAAGTNGSDISYDDGKSWQPVDNGNWNALSLPYIVGSGGRIGKLNLSAIKK